MVTGQPKKLKFNAALMLILALCLTLFLLAIKFDLFAICYNLLLPLEVYGHGYLDEYLSIVLFPALMFVIISWYKLIVLKREVASRKKAEEALRENEERFRLVFDQSGEAIILALYETGKIIYANTTIEKLLGYTREELFENGLPVLYEHFDKEVIANYINDKPLQQDFLSTRIKTTRKDGVGLVISLRIRTVRIGVNDLVYVSLRDMSEKTRLEEEARIAQAKLIHANKMSTLGTLVSGMAHEINNPNNFIMFNSGMLADIWNDATLVLDDYFRQNGDFSLGGLPYPEVGAAARKLIDGISEGSERIKIIVDDLKDFSRQDTAQTGRKMDINEAVLKAASILTPQIKMYTSNFHLLLQENIPKNAGNVHKLEQVIINLLMNALQSLPNKNCGVTISTVVKDESTLIVTIKDEGGGMTNETLARVSEPFFTTKSASSGTGLGLFISQSIITAHKGSLRFESSPGEGTSAIIELPI